MESRKVKGKRAESMKWMTVVVHAVDYVYKYFRDLFPAQAIKNDIAEINHSHILRAV